MVYRYRDDYPEQCPPATAKSPTNEVFFRACGKEIEKEGKLNANNFIPICEMPNRKFPPHRVCGSKALSFYDSVEAICRLITLHPGIGKKVVAVELNKQCGVAKKDQGGHLNLWDMCEPTIVEAIGEEWDEVKLDEIFVAQ